eukprot:8832238-Ditylum_brightwellii.AAC.1
MAFNLGVKPSIENKSAQTGSVNTFGAFLFGGETKKKEESTIEREVKEEESKELHTVEDKGEI